MGKGSNMNNSLQRILEDWQGGVFSDSGWHQNESANQNDALTCFITVTFDTIYHMLFMCYLLLTDIAIIIINKSY